MANRDYSEFPLQLDRERNIKSILTIQKQSVGYRGMGYLNRRLLLPQMELYEDFIMDQELFTKVLKHFSDTAIADLAYLFGNQTCRVWNYTGNTPEGTIVESSQARGDNVAVADTIDILVRSDPSWSEKWIQIAAKLRYPPVGDGDLYSEDTIRRRDAFCTLDRMRLITGAVDYPSTTIVPPLATQQFLLLLLEAYKLERTVNFLVSERDTFDNMKLICTDDTLRRWFFNDPYPEKNGVLPVRSNTYGIPKLAKQLAERGYFDLELDNTPFPPVTKEQLLLEPVISEKNKYWV